MKTNIELEIDELVLHGLPAGQPERIAAAIEAELLRLLEEGGLPPTLAAGAALEEVQVAVGAQTGDLGEQIAGAIYTSLGGSGENPNPQGRSKG
jgi:hypothetical protein